MMTFNTRAVQSTMCIATCATTLLLTTTVTADTTPLVVMRHTGCNSMFQHPNDAGLKRAVEMIAARLDEIPDEIRKFGGGGDAREAADAMELLLPLAASFMQYPAEFAILDNGINDYGVPDLDARIIVETGDPAIADMMVQSITTAIEMGIPTMDWIVSDVDPDMMEFSTPMGTLLFGPANDLGRFAFGFDMGGDGLNTTPVALETPAELGNSVPVFELLVDGKAILNIAEMYSGMAGDPSIPEMIAEIIESLPEGPFQIEVAAGYVGDESVTVTRFRNITALLDMMQMGDLGEMDLSGITIEQLANVPVDAQMFAIARKDIAQGIEMGMQNAANNGMPFEPDELWGMIESQIGINPMTDFIQYLGTTWITYLSDTTGGGGWMSTVFVIDGNNIEGLQQTFDELSAMANGMAAQVGYVRVHSWDSDERTSGYTLQFPGIPVPLELSLAMADDSLIVGLTPQAVVAAVDQCLSNLDGNSILNNPRFVEAASSVDMDGAIKISFVDLPVTMARGYPMAQFFGSAVANFVRSPSDPSRDPGMVTPTLPQLRKGSRALLKVGRLVGDDYVEIQRTDGSVFANISGMCGAIGLTPELIAAGAAGFGLREAMEH